MTALSARTYSDIGALGPGDTYAYACSADGTTIVGISAGRAFRWTAATGIVDIGPGTATAVSSDGAVVAGRDDSNLWFRWTAATGAVTIPAPAGFGGPGAIEYVHDCSDDGSVLVGEMSVSSSSALGAFRWTAATGMVDIGTIGPRGSGAAATCCSADGSVVLGYDKHIAFRWTEATGMVYFAGDNADTSGNTRPYACDAAGNIAAGSYYATAGDVRGMFRATAGSRIALPAPSGYLTRNTAYAMSSDGALLFGAVTGQYPNVPLRYSLSEDETTTYVPATIGLADFVPEGGLVEDCSADGVVLVGGIFDADYNYRAFTTGSLVASPSEPPSEPPAVGAPLEGLRKTAIVTHTPAVAERAYRAASRNCVDYPPVGAGGGSNPPGGPPSTAPTIPIGTPVWAYPTVGEGFASVYPLTGYSCVRSTLFVYAPGQTEPATVYYVVCSQN